MFAAACALAGAGQAQAAEVTPSGSFTHHVPIGMPAGTNGVAPRLSFDYNSANRANGLLGVGWQLSGIPVVTRVAYGREVRFDGNDTYAGPGGRLIDVSGNRTAYHHADETWDKLVPSGVCGDGPCSWTLYDARGLRMEFGTTTDSRLFSNNSVRTWGLARVIDVHGNSYRVTYATGTTADGVLLPQKVTYTEGNGLTKFRTILFEYESRTDVEPAYLYRGMQRWPWRLSGVTVAVDGALVRRYALAYELAPVTGVSRLKSIKEIGNDGASSLPPQVFTYGATGMTFVSSSGGVQPTNCTYLNVVDVTGDGRGDLVRFCPGSWRVEPGVAAETVVNGLENLTQRFGSAVATSDGTSASSIRHIDVADVTGDGKADAILLLSDGSWRVRASAGNGTFLAAVPTLPTATITSWETVRITDVTGDGRADAVFLASDGYWHMRAGMVTGVFGSEVKTQNLEELAATSCLNLVDVTGDQRPDLVYIAKLTGELVVRPGQSTADFGAAVRSVPSAVAVGSCRLGDVNADGRADLIVVGTDGTYHVRVSQGPGVFVATARTYPSSGTVGYLALGDYDGDGAADLLTRIGNNYRLRRSDRTGGLRPEETLAANGAVGADVTVSADLDGDGRSEVISNIRSRYDCSYPRDRFPRYCTRLTIGVWSVNVAPGDLLTGFANGMGGTTAVTYVPAPKVAGAVMPNAYGQGMANSSSRALAVRTATSDGRGATYSTAYRYENGRLYIGSLTDRADLGFALVRQTDEQARTYGVTTFRQDRPFEQRLLRVAQHSSDAKLLGATDYTYLPVRRCNESGCVTDGNPALPRLIVADEVIVRRYEMGTPLFDMTTKSLAYDAFGNPLIIAALGAPGVEDDSYLLRSYINDPAKRAIGIQFRETSCGDQSCVLMFKDQRTYFDGLGLGAIGSRGLITKVEEWMGGTLWASSTYGYDVHGNRTSSTDANGVTATITMDPVYRSFREKSYTRGQLVSDTLFDARYGEPVRMTDQNGIVVESPVDVFGYAKERKTTGPSGLLRWETFSLTIAAPISKHQACKLYDGGAKKICVTDQKDGLGRTFRSEAQGATGVLYTDTLYDAAGRVYRKSEPYLAGKSPVYTTNTYDTAGRLWKTTYPNGLVSVNAVSLTGLAPGARWAETVTASGKTSRVEKDVRGLVVRKVDGIVNGAGGVAVQYTYDRRGDLTQVSTPGAGGALSGSLLGPKTTLYHDAVGRKLRTVDATAGETRWTYGATPGTPSFGKVMEETTASHNYTTGTVYSRHTYDALGRISTTSVNGARTVNYYYDETSLAGGKGRLTRVVDRTNGYTITTRYAYDHTGAVKDTYERIQGPGIDREHHHAITRDQLGRDVSITLPSGAVISQTYTDWGALAQTYYSPDATAVTDPSKVFAWYSGYDARGRIGRVDRQNGTYTTYEYDSMGQLRRSRTLRGTAPLLDWTYAFNALGTLQSIADGVVPNLTWKYTYDGLDRLSTATRGGRTFTYGFDEAGNLAKNDGVGQFFDEGTNRLLQTAQDPIPRTYSASGNLLTRNGARFSYDEGGKLKQSWVTPTGTTTERNTRYFYRHDGTRFLKIYQAAGQPEVRTYYIGGLYEVRETWQNGVSAGAQTTTYVPGPAGERLASVTTSMTLAALEQSRVSGNHYAMAGMTASHSVSGLALGAYHGTAGFLTSIDGPRTMMRALLGTAAILLVLLALRFVLGIRLRRRGRRVFTAPVRARRSLGVVALMLCFVVFGTYGCGPLEPGMFEEQGQEIITGDTSNGLPAGTVFFHSNHLNSSSLITDAAGFEIVRLNYLPFGAIDQQYSGRLVAGVIQPATDSVTFKFTGQEHDPESGLYYYNARYYDPQTGTFLSADSDPSTSRVQSYNRYAYAEGNPINYSDPTGHFSLRDLVKAVIMVVVAIVLAVIAIYCPPLAVAIVGLAAAYQGYEGYQTGGWRGAMAGTISGVINAVLTYYEIPLSVSFSYTHAGGWGFSVGVGYCGVGLAAGYSEAGGYYAGGSYGDFGVTANLQYAEGGQWSGGGGMDYASSYGAVLSYGLTVNEGGRTDTSLSSSYTAANACAFMYKSMPRYLARGQMDTGSASVGGITTSDEGQDQIGRDTGSMVIGNPTEGIMSDLVQCSLGKLPLVGPLVGLLTNPSVLVLTMQVVSGKVSHVNGHSQGAIIASNALWLARMVNWSLGDLSVTTFGGAAAFFPPGTSVTHHVFRGDLVGEVLGGRLLLRGGLVQYPKASGFNSFSGSGNMDQFWRISHGWGSASDPSRGYRGVVLGNVAPGR